MLCSLWPALDLTVAADRPLGDEAIKELNEHLAQYQFIEQNLAQKRARLMLKLPEIRKTLEAITLLLEKQAADEEVAPCILPWLLVSATACALVVTDEQRHGCQAHDYAVQVLFDFELANQVYAKARVNNASSVNLWLGAEVMLEYPIQEAKELLVSAALVTTMHRLRERAPSHHSMQRSLCRWLAGEQC